MGASAKAAVLLGVVVVMATFATESEGAIPASTWRTVQKVNEVGPFLGLVVPNSFEMSPLFQSNSFVPYPCLPYLDFGGKGRRFRFGSVGKEKCIVVMTGLGMLNAGLTTQLLLSLFDVKGVVHFGVAGNANPDLQIGDVTIPQYWSHTGLWNWQAKLLFLQNPKKKKEEENKQTNKQKARVSFLSFNSTYTKP